MKQVFNRFSLVRCVLLFLGLFALKFLYPLSLRALVLRDVSIHALDFEGAFKLGDLGKAVKIGLAAVLSDSETAQYAELFFLLVEGLGKLGLNYLEGFLLAVALVHKSALLLYEDGGGVSDFNKTTKSEVKLGSLWDITNFRVLSIKLREQMHVALILIALLSGTTRIAEKGVRGEHLLELITHWLCFKAPFKPHSHFYYLLI